MVPYRNKLCTLCINYGGQLTRTCIWNWIIVFPMAQGEFLLEWFYSTLSYLQLDLLSYFVPSNFQFWPSLFSVYSSINSPYFHNSTASTSTFRAISGNISHHLWWCPLTETLPSVLDDDSKMLHASQPPISYSQYNPVNCQKPKSID